MKQHFDCDCGSSEHTMHFWVDTDSEPPVVYSYVFLYNWEGFWKRVLVAIKYIFGYNSRYGHWDEFIWSQEELTKLRDFLDEQTGKKVNAEEPVKSREAVSGASPEWAERIVAG